MGSNILVLGNNERSVLTTVRSLDNDGHNIDVFGISESSITAHSKSVRMYYFLNTDVVDELHKYIIGLLSNNTYDLLIPCTDVFCLLVESRRARYQDYVVIALPKNGLYERASDKNLLVDIASELNILAPDTILIRKGGVISENMNGNIKFPLYAKPRKSVLIHNGRLQVTQVRKIYDNNQLKRYLHDYIDRVDLLLQDSVPGVGNSAYIFAVDGKILSITGQLRLHEPKGGGGSSYRVTCELDEYLHSASKALVERYEWTGPMMIEYKYDSEAQVFYIMEINARVWGSLPLTVNSGHDIPKYIYEYFCHGTLPVFRKPIIGLRQRHLVRDVSWLLSKKRRVRDYIEWILGFRYHLKGQEFFDVERLADCKPALRSYYLLIKVRISQIIRVSGILLNNIEYFRFALRASRKQVVEIARSKDALNILFVCRGNVARSVFCEHWASDEITDCKFLSAGTIGIEGRRPQPELLDFVCNEQLAQHHSVSLANIDKDWPDIIFVMDTRNLHDIKDFEFNSKIVFPLSCLASTGPIDDPDKADPEHIPEIVEVMTRNLKSLRQVCKERFSEQ